jgi:two-component system chemotaxis response regulator CheY
MVNVRAGFRNSRYKGREDRSRVNLLVVDDLPPMREIIRSMLKSNGYSSLHQAENGVEALRVIRSKPIDLVITDWNMPNMTGIELLKTIRGDVDLFSRSVLIVSDEVSLEKVLYAIEEGVNGFVTKPFSETELVKRLRHVLDLVANPPAIQQKVDQMRRLKLSHNYSEALRLGLEILASQNHPVVGLMACECLYHLKDYDKAIQLISDTEEAARTSQHVSLLGKIFLSLGKRDDAVLYLEQAVRRNPVNDERKIDLAWAYFSTGNIGKAERLIDEVMQANPTDLNMVAIGKLYLERGEVDKAAQYLDQTVNPIPETVHVFNDYAIALRRAERYEDSIKIYRKCLKINPDSDVLHYNLGFLCNFVGDYSGAKEALQNAIRLNPANEQARKLLKNIGSRLH